MAVTPEQAVAAYKQDIQEIKQRTEEAKDKLKALTGSTSSPDGAVTVTVNAGGQLQKLSFGPRADSMSKEQLAALVITTARHAQARATSQIAEVMAPIIGDDTPAMAHLKDAIPVLEEPEEQQPGQQQPAAQQTQRPQPAQTQQQPRQPMRRQTGDDEDFESAPVTRQDDW